MDGLANININHRHDRHYISMTRVYKDYPAFAEAGINRPLVYNKQVAEINRLANEGKIYDIAPKKPVKIKRVEGNVKKIRKLYERGKKEGEEYLPGMLRYLEKVIRIDIM